MVGDQYILFHSAHPQVLNVRSVLTSDSACLLTAACVQTLVVTGFAVPGVQVSWGLGVTFMEGGVTLTRDAEKVGCQTFPSCLVLDTPVRRLLGRRHVLRVR